MNIRVFIYKMIKHKTTELDEKNPAHYCSAGNSHSVVGNVKYSALGFHSFLFLKSISSVKVTLIDKCWNEILQRCKT